MMRKIRNLIRAGSLSKNKTKTRRVNRAAAVMLDAAETWALTGGGSDLDELTALKMAIKCGHLDGRRIF